MIVPLFIHVFKALGFFVLLFTLPLSIPVLTLEMAVSPMLVAPILLTFATFIFGGAISVRGEIVVSGSFHLKERCKL